MKKTILILMSIHFLITGMEREDIPNTENQISTEIDDNSEPSTKKRKIDYSEEDSLKIEVAEDFVVKSLVDLCVEAVAKHKAQENPQQIEQLFEKQLLPDELLYKVREAYFRNHPDKAWAQFASKKMRTMTCAYAEPKEVFGYDISDDGSSAIFVSDNGFGLISGQRYKFFSYPNLTRNNYTCSPIISRNGKFAVIFTEPGIASIIDMESFKGLHQLKPENMGNVPQDIYKMLFCNNDKLILICYGTEASSIVKIWNCETGKEKYSVLLDEEDQPRSIKISNNSKIAFLDYGVGVKILDVQAGNILHTFMYENGDPDDYDNNFVLSPKNNFIILLQDDSKSIEVYNLKTAEKLYKIEQNNFVAVSPDDNFLITIDCKTRMLIKREITSGESIKELEFKEDLVTDDEYNRYFDTMYCIRDIFFRNNSEQGIAVRLDDEHWLKINFESGKLSKIFKLPNFKLNSNKKILICIRKDSAKKKYLLSVVETDSFKKLAGFTLPIDDCEELENSTKIEISKNNQTIFIFGSKVYKSVVIFTDPENKSKDQ